MAEVSWESWAARLAGGRGAVTGASGFLGRHLLRELPSDVSVVAAYHSADDFPAFAETCRARVEPVRVDLADEPFSTHVDGGVDWLLHLAARLPADPGRAVDAFTAAAANAVRGLETRNVVDVSSGSVYEGLRGDLQPGRPLAPRSSYAIAKLAAERSLAASTQAQTWHARVFFPYGPGERQGRLVRSLVEAAVAGRDRVELTLAPDHRVDPMWVTDTVRALLVLAVVPGEGRAIDVAAGRPLPITELAETVTRIAADAAGRPAPEVVLTAPRGGESLPGVTSSAELDRLVGLPRLSLEEGIRRYARLLANPSEPGG